MMEDMVFYCWGVWRRTMEVGLWRTGILDCSV